MPLLRFCLIAFWLCYTPNLWAMDLKLAEQRIFELSNQLRRQQQLAPLNDLTPLNETARFHSRQMAQQGFFSHTDPQARQPKDRLKHLFPGLVISTIGENIAYNFASNEEELAQKIVLQWKNSPGHYANIIGKSYTHLGVGLSAAGTKIYATQVFGAPLAYSQKPLPETLQQGYISRIKMEFVGAFPKSELYFYLNVPDKKARFYINKSTFYTGGGPLKPKWLDEQHLEIELPSQYGLGDYELGVGRKQSFAPFHRYQVIKK